MTTSKFCYSHIANLLASIVHNTKVTAENATVVLVTESMSLQSKLHFPSVSSVYSTT